MYRRILVPTDGSPCSARAVADAIDVAKAMGATVIFLCAIDPVDTYREGVVTWDQARETLSAHGTAMLNRARDAAQRAGVESATELVEGTPADVILERSADFDLVVMGSHGKGLWERLTVGSVTQAVLRRITRPMLIVHAADGARSSSG